VRKFFYFGNYEAAVRISETAYGNFSIRPVCGATSYRYPWDVSLNAGINNSNFLINFTTLKGEQIIRGETDMMDNTHSFRLKQTTVFRILDLRPSAELVV
jgi:hypothetical protein